MNKRKMTIRFIYTNKKNETKERLVKVIAKTNTYLYGIDMNLLTADKREEVSKLRIQVQDTIEKKRTEQLKSYMKAIRMFKIRNIKEL